MNSFVTFLKKNLFYSVSSTILSVSLLLSSIFLSVRFIQWAFIDSLWSGTAADCRKIDGACWAFLNEKINFILIGFYPQSEMWRPALALVLFLILVVYVARYTKWNRYTPVIAFILLIAVSFLLYGGLFGLEIVSPKVWGGLILTIVLTTIGSIVAYPLGVLFALGRMSKLPMIKTVSVIYIELIRGVPLISLLFMSSVMLPFILPPDWSVDKLTRAQIAIVLFIGAYMAEVIRGGLQGIPKGQYEASDSLGLGYWKCNIFIILPQALKIVIPPTVGVFIGAFQDTTLVIIISMFDVLGTVKAALADSKWLGFSREAYFFLMLLFFVFCYSMAVYSKKLEKTLNVGHK